MNLGCVVSTGNHMGTLFQEMDWCFFNTLSFYTSQILLTFDQMLVMERTLFTGKVMNFVERQDIWIVGIARGVNDLEIIT